MFQKLNYFCYTVITMFVMTTGTVNAQTVSDNMCSTEEGKAAKASVRDTTELDEVAVGYGTMKKKDVTGSVSSVKKEDLNKVAAANALQAIQAKVPGLDIQQNSGEAGSGISMRLRGNRSLMGGNSPLIIVDGMEYGSNLDIPASEIESVDVLKDAASTSIYGSKGANGVIIIKTKRGKASR